MVRIGVYVCHCGLNIAGTINVKEVVGYAGKLPNVVVARDYVYLCSSPGQLLIQEDIKNYGLDRVVVASCSPRMHEETFRKALQEANLNPYLLEMANLREQCSWCHADEPEKATEKAKEILKMSVARAALLEPLEKQKIKAKKAALIVGGGIAGIQASLDLANAGFRVYLVEKSPSLGGKMAKLDKTFPTLDCSACILTPKMVDAAKHSRIKLFTNAEIKEVSGYVGNYQVVINKKPRYVDENKCVGCGVCVQVCPVKVSDPFNEGLSQTKAISIYSPHAVPKVASIDASKCLRIKYNACGKCAEACEAKAIDFAQKPKTVKVQVGAVIIAIGCEIFNANNTPELGYGRSKDVITNIEFERFSDASGPTCGKILRPSTHEPPKNIAFIQCVGSRDLRFFPHCCRIGCMATLKQAILAREKLGKEANIYVCFNDMRAFGKGYEEFYQRAREMDIKFIAGLPSEVKVQPDQTLKFDVYDSSVNKLLQIHADLLVLATGLIPSPDSDQIQALFHIPRSPEGFFLEAHPKLRPLETSTVGVFLAGTCQGPKDIPDTVGQASGAASKVIELLSRGVIEIEPIKAIVEEDFCSGCGICEVTCPFFAIGMDTVKINGKEKRVARVKEALCQGCGVCVTACPSGSIKIKHHTKEQILAQIAVFSAGKEVKMLYGN